MRIREKYIARRYMTARTRIVDGEIILGVPGEGAENGPLNVARKPEMTYRVVTHCDILLSPADVSQTRAGADIDADAEVHIPEVVISEPTLIRVNIGGTLSAGIVSGGDWFIVKRIEKSGFLVRQFLGVKLVLKKDK